MSENDSSSGVYVGIEFCHEHIRKELGKKANSDKQTYLSHGYVICVLKGDKEKRGEIYGYCLRQISNASRPNGVL